MPDELQPPSSAHAVVRALPCRSERPFSHQKEDTVLMHQHPPRRKRSQVAAVAPGLALVLTVLSGGAAVAAPTAASVSITATPTSTVGETVDVAVDLVGTVDVYAYQLTLEFDPELFSYVPDSMTGPAGGFDTVQEGDGTVTLVHSRLGTSPALAGDIEASLSLEPVGTGSGSLDATSVTLVDAGGAATDLVDAATTAIVVTPVATPTPTPTATPTPTPTATATPTPTPSPTAAPTPTAAPAPGTGTPATGARASAGGSLPRTGADIAGLALAALAAVAAGAGALALRRRAMRSR